MTPEEPLLSTQCVLHTRSEPISQRTTDRALKTSSLLSNYKVPQKLEERLLISDELPHTP